MVRSNYSTVMLVTSWCWRLKVVDRLRMLVELLFSDNDQICHQHISSPSSVSNIRHQHPSSTTIKPNPEIIILETEQHSTRLIWFKRENMKNEFQYKHKHNGRNCKWNSRFKIIWIWWWIFRLLLLRKSTNWPKVKLKVIF